MTQEAATGPIAVIADDEELGRLLLAESAAALRRMYSIRWGSSDQLTGLQMKSVAPASNARLIAAAPSWPVTMTMGTVAMRGSARSRRQTE